jgi:hypothetical protein
MSVSVNNQVVKTAILQRRVRPVHAASATPTRTCRGAPPTPTNLSATPPTPIGPVDGAADRRGRARTCAWHPGSGPRSPDLASLSGRG